MPFFITELHLGIVDFLDEKAAVSLFLGFHAIHFHRRISDRQVFWMSIQLEMLLCVSRPRQMFLETGRVSAFTRKKGSPEA